MTKAFTSPLHTDITIEEDSATIGGVKFSCYHAQERCEVVYADFSLLEGFKQQISDLGGITQIVVSDVEGMGFNIALYNGKTLLLDQPEKVDVLINCYNDQNGYYSDDLELTVEYEGQEDSFYVSKLDK